MKTPILSVLAILLCLSARAEGQTPPAAADPAIEIPHSSRTKGNLSDIALDFLLTKLFAKQKNVKITYDFVESSFSDKTVAFRNLTIRPERPDVSGVIRLGLVKLDLNDLLGFLDTGVATVAGIDASDVKISLDVYESGQKRKSVLAAADAVKIDQLTEQLNTADRIVTEDVLVLKTAEISNGKLYLPLTKERFAAQKLLFRGFSIRLSGEKGISFDSASVNGKTAATEAELKKLLTE